MGEDVENDVSSHENGTLERGITVIGSRIRRSSDSDDEDVAGACTENQSIVNTRSPFHKTGIFFNSPGSQSKRLPSRPHQYGTFCASSRADSHRGVCLERSN